MLHYDTIFPDGGMVDVRFEMSESEYSRAVLPRNEWSARTYTYGSVRICPDGGMVDTYA